MKRFVSKQNRALVSELVRTDFKLRYQGSVLGYAWSLLRPLLLFVILYIVFVKFLKLGSNIPHFPVYLLLGIVMWNFFFELTVQGLGSIVGRGDLIRKVRIPRWIIVLSSSLSALINFGLNLIVIAIFMVINHVDPMATLLWLPLIFAEVYLFAVGLAFLLSAMFVRFRDIGYIWEVVLQAGFYITPIIYPLSRITNITFQKLILMNPMAQTIQDARYAAIGHETVIGKTVFEGGWHQFIPFIIVLVVFVVGITYFRREAKYFAENI